MKKQMAFGFVEKPAPKFFGGSSLKGRRKSARPLSTKYPIHLILKSNGPLFHRRLLLQKKTLNTLSKRFGIRVFASSFNFNHLHLVMQISSRQNYTSFVRSFAASVVRVTGRAKVFQERPFTRIGTWGRDFKNLLNYLFLNELQAEGIKKASGRLLSRLWSTDDERCPSFPIRVQI